MEVTKTRKDIAILIELTPDEVVEIKTNVIDTTSEILTKIKDVL